MIKEIIVVEGKDDTTAIRRAVDADTLETGGSAIDETVLRQIELAQQRRGVIVFTDPDHPGERIRKLISARVPGCKHAYLPKEDAIRKGKVGVENAKPEAIRRALEQLHTEVEDAQERISFADLIAAGLIDHPQAAERRERVCRILGIGYCNGKQLHKRCRMYRITEDEFRGAVNQLEE